MTETLKQPHNTPIDSKRYKLVEVYKYTTNIYQGVPYKIVVPKDFIYDGASIPRILWSLSGIRPDGLIRAAALVHDFLYRYRGRLPKGHSYYWDIETWRDSNSGYSRSESDKVFLELMGRAKISKVKRYLAYYAVRLFGRFSWKEDNKDNE